jgi:hypothetical protein
MKKDVIRSFENCEICYKTKVIFSKNTKTQKNWMFTFPGLFFSQIIEMIIKFNNIEDL